MRKNIIGMGYFNTLLIFFLLLLIGFGLCVPSLSVSAAEPFITSDLILQDSAVTNSPTEFTVKLNNIKTIRAGNLSLKIVLTATTADLKSLELMTDSGWKTITINPQGPNLVATFFLTDGLLFGNEKNYPFKAVFANAKDYLIGFNLESIEGDKTSVLSSTARLLKVSTGKILGTSTFIFRQNLQIGNRGEEVRQLQLALTRAGVYSGPITGYFGTLTKEAVRAYQKTKGISPLGIVGPLTRQALNGM